MYYHNMQNNITDCGIAVLKTVLQQFGRKLPRNFAEEIIVEGQGLSLNDLKKVLQMQGIYASAYEVTDIQEVKNIMLPSIAIIDENGKNHYVVVHSYNDKSGEMILSNPAQIKITKVHIDEFKKVFSGYMLCIEKVEEMISENTENSLYNDVINTISIGIKLKYSFLAVIKWSIPILLLFLMQYLFMFHIEKMSYLNILLVVMIFTFLSIGYYYICLVYQNYKTDLEKSISTKMAMEYLMNEINVINTKKNVNNTEGIFWNIIISVIGILQKFYFKIDLILIAIFISVIAILDWVYTIIILVFISGICVYGYTFKNLIKNRQVELIGASSELSACIQEMTQSSLDLKIFSETKIIERYCNYIHEKYENVRQNINQEDMKMMAFYDMSSYIAMAVGLAVIFTSYNMNVEFSSSTMVMTFYMTIFIIMTFKSTFQRWIEYQKSVNAIEYIEYMVSPEAEKQEKSNLDFEQITEFEFSQIEVKIEDCVILNKLDFKINQGTIIGIEGENGSGKSTFAKTILGLINPTKGKIKINGIEVDKNLSNSDITRYISFYSSELYVYCDSVKNNINFNVCHNQNVNIKYSYMNELEMDYLLFLNGINISQGERQKILLDRCFEKERSIYIFDEPGVNLDYNSHQKMLEMFKHLKDNGKIVLIISHEKEILSNCDRRYRMKDGRLHKIGE